MASDFAVPRDERLKRLRARLQGGAPARDFEGRAESSRSARLLYGVMLHGAARLHAGLELTDLEARLVGPLLRLLSQEEVGDFGRIYQEESATRAKIFPDALASRPLEQGYAVKDLIEDLPALGEEIAAQANVSIVDLDTPAGGEDGSWDSKEFCQGMGAYGYGATVVTASGHQAPSADKPALQVDMTHPRFKCDRESHEFSGSNEVYWALSAGADNGDKQAGITRTYGDVDSGETHDMDANTVLFRGAVDKVLLCHIELWEQDSGVDPELGRTIQEIATTLQDTAEVMSAIPAGGPWQYMHQFIAMVGSVGQLIGEIVEWLADDLLHHRTIAFDRAAMEVLSDPTLPNPDTTWWFQNPSGAGAEGRFSLDIRGRYAQASSNGVGLLTLTGSQWAGPARPWPTSRTQDTPAFATHNGILHCAVRGLDNAVYISQRQNNQWGTFRKIPGTSTLHAPTLASTGGRLYLGFTVSSGDTTNNSGHCRYSTDGVDWPTTDLTGPGSAHRRGFTLASHSGRLWFAAFSGGSIDEYREFRVTSYDTIRWVDWGLHHQHKSMYSPALATFQGKLYMAYTNLGGRVCVTPRNDGAWPAPVQLPGTSTASPALTVLGTTLYCAIRGTDDRIYVSSSTNGSSWSSFSPITRSGATSLSGPGLTADGTTLLLAFRTLV
ncbi:hypothetical protein [Streptomyces sp. NPDC003032]